MKREFSSYLNLIRVAAATTVFAAHLTFTEFTGGRFSYQGKLAGEGVAAFFVLSGYVIAFVAAEKERAPRNYVISRLARVYSVALPAIALAIAVDLLALHFSWPRNVPVYQYLSFPKYLLLAVTFAGQAGPLSESAFGAHTFWSLDYEVWYYTIFACAFYFSGYKRILLSGLVLIAAGPGIVIDFPMWLLGMAIYRLHASRPGHAPFAGVFFFSSLLALVAYRLSWMDIKIDDWVNLTLGGWPHQKLSNSEEFASEYVAAALVGLNIFSARYLPLSALRPTRISNAISWLASLTFTLYLTQRSLLDLFVFSSNYNPHSLVNLLVLVIATLASVWLLAQVTEHKKLWWRAVFSRIIPGKSHRTL
jgi:peptidoglycan/LPS O-acetylase OafA/YrhL